jgi:hypothetical protein
MAVGPAGGARTLLWRLACIKDALGRPDIQLTAGQSGWDRISRPVEYDPSKDWIHV